jgi:hypothetical protein
VDLFLAFQAGISAPWAEYPVGLDNPGHFWLDYLAG